VPRDLTSNSPTGPGAPAVVGGWAALALVVAPLIVVASPGAQQAAGEQWVRIFDGKTLDGWEGRTDVFRVDDGAIVAGSATEPTPRNEFLCTLAEYGDFVLRLEFRMPGEG
jgi:hypothetical protein